MAGDRGKGDMGGIEYGACGDQHFACSGFLACWADMLAASRFAGPCFGAEGQRGHTRYVIACPATFAA
ncbi:hypothetical protein GCM10027038_27350 [Arthrobacter bambusae]